MMNNGNVMFKMTMIVGLNAFMYILLDLSMYDECGTGTLKNEMLLPISEGSSSSSSSSSRIIIKSNSLMTYRNPDIIANGCALTILFVDPRVTKAKAKSETWWSLESMATNVIPKNRTCVVIQTSSTNCGGSITAPAQIYKHITSSALPRFRSMIDMGNVRVDFLTAGDPYAIGHCKWNVNRLFMHPNYWQDEFVPQDSDLVIVLQPDSVFCHAFDVSRWTDLAFVGGVWPPKPNTHNNPAPPAGVCHQIPLLWKQWGHNEDEAFPDVCTDGRAPLGNGGFSLRSRHWMTKATNTCPSFNFHQFNTKCVNKGDVAEDLYFATVLPGINAPMPNPIEAALFGVEMIFLEKVMEYYANETQVNELETIVQKRWGDIDKFNRMRQIGTTIPIGMHKPYWYHNKKFLASPYMKKECPFLGYILPKY